MPGAVTPARRLARTAAALAVAAAPLAAGCSATQPASPGSAAGPASAGVLPSRTTAIDVPAGKPLTRIALHGALAASTILLVVLAAVGAG